MATSKKRRLVWGKNNCLHSKPCAHKKMSSKKKNNKKNKKCKALSRPLIFVVNPNDPSPLLRLPRELRDVIYGYAVYGYAVSRIRKVLIPHYRKDLYDTSPLAATCKQIRHEATKVSHKINDFALRRPKRLSKATDEYLARYWPPRNLDELYHKYASLVNPKAISWIPTINQAFPLLVSVLSSVSQMFKNPVASKVWA